MSESFLNGEIYPPIVLRISMSNDRYITHTDDLSIYSPAPTDWPANVQSHVIPLLVHHIALEPFMSWLKTNFSSSYYMLRRKNALLRISDEFVELCTIDCYKAEIAVAIKLQWHDSDYIIETVEI